MDLDGAGLLAESGVGADVDGGGVGTVGEPGEAGQGRSADGTLIYEWKVSAEGARTFKARLWNGRSYRVILNQNVAAPPK